MKPKAWKPLPTSIRGPCHPLHEQLAAANERFPLPVFDGSSPLYVFSDYGGEDEKRRFKTYSFLVCDVQRNKCELDAVENAAKQYLEGQSLEFKKINRRRLRAIVPFWREVRNCSALAITIGVDQSLGALARPNEATSNANIDHSLIAEIERLPPVNKEHLHRVLHFFGLMLRIAGHANQRVCWITDNDKFFQNDTLKRILKESCQNLFTQYAPDIPEMDVWVDSASPVPYTRMLMWVPDLLAGAWWERLSQSSDQINQRDSGLLVTGTAALSPKTQSILRESNCPSPSFRSIAISLRDVNSTNQIGHKLEWDSVLPANPF